MALTQGKKGLSSRKGAMQNIKIITILWCLKIVTLSAATIQEHSPKVPKSKTLESLPKKIQQYILKKGPYALVLVKDLPKNKQKLDYQIIGLHSKSCQIALSRISQYPRYREWIGLIKESRYHPSLKRVYFKLSHGLMPFTMVLNFKLPIIKKPGQYPFQFDNGFLKGLKGTITVRKTKGRCLFRTEAHWSGPHSGINSKIFSFFSRTLGILTMEKLFKISRTY